MSQPAADAGTFRREGADEIVERLNSRPWRAAAAEVTTLPMEQIVRVFRQPFLHSAARLALGLPRWQARSVLAGIAIDRVADIFRKASRKDREALFPLLSSAVADRVRALLVYPADTAGGIMTTEFVSVPTTATVAETFARIREIDYTRETIYPIYVVDADDGHLVEAVSLRRLILASPSESILSHCIGAEPYPVSPATDREEVGRLIAKHDLLAVPVVDGNGNILGIVTVDDVIDAILTESTEDVQRFGGVAGVEGPYLKIGFGRMIWTRGGWLCALFLSEMLTASAMQHFESELEKAVVLTLFIPLIMSSGGNAGSQATSLLIRALALGQLRLRDWWKVALLELPVGVALGAILGVIGMMRITIWQIAHIYDYGAYWPLIALTVGLGLVGIVTFGSMAGSMLPFVLKRLGFDPASASAPFVATLVDVTGLVIYFNVALLVLHGTLL